jgi:hypothetical protein
MMAKWYTLSIVDRETEDVQDQAMHGPFEHDEALEDSITEEMAGVTDEGVVVVAARFELLDDDAVPEIINI